MAWIGTVPRPQRAAHLVLLVSAACTHPPLASPPAAARDSTAFLFSYFTRNGEDGVHLAYSRDGVTWLPLLGGRAGLHRVPVLLFHPQRRGRGPPRVQPRRCHLAPAPRRARGDPAGGDGERYRLAGVEPPRRPDARSEHPAGAGRRLPPGLDHRVDRPRDRRSAPP